MFNVGGPEIMVIILVALIVLGPQQLPKAMRTFGNVMAEIRKVSSGFQAEMKSAMDTFTEDDTPRKEKPQSGTMATPDRSGDTKALTAETMEQADVTEVVGRNPGKVDLDKRASTAEAGSEDADRSAQGSTSAAPVANPADRAAG